MKFKTPIHLTIVIIICIVLISSCNVNEKKQIKKFVIIVKSDNNAYNEEIIKGFVQVIESLGGKAIVKRPVDTSVVAQVNIINRLIAEKVDSIAIAGNDENALQPVLTNAIEDGIKVLSFDAAVNAKSRMLHINQADGREVGEKLIESANELANGSGQIAIISTTNQSHNQNTWIYWMRRELEAGKYPDLSLVDIVYGEDNYTISLKKVNELIRNYPNLKVIVAPTAVGVHAAANSVTAKKLQDQIKITGLGLPSEMHPYIGENKVCPYMYLWNPIEVGTLTAYASWGFVNGEITGKEGEVLHTEEMGTFQIEEDEFGGTYITLQSGIIKFDETNIKLWKNKY